jgi:hypothetical protein
LPNCFPYQSLPNRFIPHSHRLQSTDVHVNEQRIPTRSNSFKRQNEL